MSGVDPSSTFLGAPTALPVAVAPMAFQSLAHSDGEIEAARGAAAAGIPYTLSTTSSQPIEAVAAGAPGGTLWFQLYAQRPGRHPLTRRAGGGGGIRAIVLTVDLPVLGYRPIGPAGGLRAPADGQLRGVPAATVATHSTPSLLPDPGIEPTLIWADLATIRSWSSLPLVLKGIVTAEDAILAVEHGADGIIVSNHGARQLDRVFPRRADVLGRGRRCGRRNGPRYGSTVASGSGLDIVTALALGARGVLIGRPDVLGPCRRRAGRVSSAPIHLVREELTIAMGLLGTPTPADITRDHVGG